MNKGKVGGGEKQKASKHVDLKGGLRKDEKEDEMLFFTVPFPASAHCA